MTTHKLQERGQITIPKAIRDRYGLRPGEPLEFVLEEDGFRVRKAADEADPIWRIFGSLKRGVDTDEFIEEIRGR
jgi:AbrB family looped-hinge helix DNA binding protein